MAINNLPHKSSDSLLVKEKPTIDSLQAKVAAKTKTTKSSSYLQTYFCLIFIYFLSIGITNFLVNPQKLFSDRNFFNFKEKKPFEKWLDNARYHKANQIAKGNYNTLIMGNSRAFGGLEPRHPSLARYSAYNAALPLANIQEIERAFNYAKKKSELKQIIIGLDLAQFSNRRSVEGDFNQSRFAGEIPYYTTYFSKIFSTPYFIDSLKIVKSNLQNKSVQEDSKFQVINGFREKNKGYRSYPQAQFISYAESFISDEGYIDFPYSQERLKRLKNIIARCREEGIEIKLFISPVHAWQLEFMEVSNTFAIFEQWKQDLVNIIAEDATNNPEKSPILLWDFSGYNTITTELVPLNSDREMQWYNDPSHYTKEVGDLVLSKILDYPQSDKNQIKNFGVLIDRDNIKSHLSTIRQQQSIYQQNHTEDITAIKEIAR